MDALSLVRTRFLSHACVQLLLSDVSPLAVLAHTLHSREARAALSSVERSFVRLLCALLRLHVTMAARFLLRRMLPRWARPRDEAAAVGVAVILDWVGNLLITPAVMAAFLRHREGNCGPAAGYGDCSLVFMRTISLVRAFRPVAAQLPPRLAFAPEAARAAVTSLRARRLCRGRRADGAYGGVGTNRAVPGTHCSTPSE